MGVSTTHRINLSMWILIYSFSDTYYVWAACGYKGEIKTIILIFSVPKTQNFNEEEKMHNEISKEPAARLSGKLSYNWLIMLVTMATPIFSRVRDENSIFTASDEDMIFS